MSEHHPYIGPKIKYYRESHGWDLRELERRSGVPWSSIGQYERRATAPPYAKCVKLAKALGVSISMIWDMDPPPVRAKNLPPLPE